jgi:predicted nuclease of predicted toxin-antitoxin system
MKLLFDENLSPKLPRLIATAFPGSKHARECGLKGNADEDLWAYAREHGFTVISKDSDFYDLSSLEGSPPKLVWLRVGNCSRAELLRLITDNAAAIEALENDPLESMLVLS